MARGYKDRFDTQMQVIAWHAANVMNVHLKKSVSPDKLLGKKKEMSPLDRESEVEKLRAALAERRVRNGG